MSKILKIIILVFTIIFFMNLKISSAEEKIKIGILVPMTGNNKELGQSIVKATKLALKDINTDKIEIYPKDTGSDPSLTLKAAKEFNEMGIQIVIGPIFYKNLIYLNEVENIIFLSLTNRTIDLPSNVISSGVNATSQLNAIKKFIKLNEINKTIFLTPKLDYELEVKKAIKKSKIKIVNHHIYDTEPTKLTKQIEKITNYKVRKQNVLNEIKRIEKSDLPESSKEIRIEKLKKRYTIGNINFDAVIISDFSESLKSVVTSLLYTDVLPEKKYIITFNQWFDESLLNEKTLQPIYYPSINKKNLENFEKKYSKEFNNKPNHLGLLSYDLIGLIYYPSLQNDIFENEKLFKKKTTFKGKVGIFDIQNNKINYRLNFYKIEESKIKEIF